VVHREGGVKEVDVSDVLGVSMTLEVEDGGGGGGSGDEDGGMVVPVARARAHHSCC